MKKGAYDLGRKAMYYIVVMIIIAILFTYMTNNFHKYKVTMISNLDEVTDLVIINNIMKCVSQKDEDTGKISFYIIDKKMLEGEALMNCLGNDKPYTDKSIKLKIGNIETVTQKPFFEYNEYQKMVEYQGEAEELKISIEKYTRIV